MSTKYLARTVIEGGRYYFNSWERRHSSKVERAKVRSELRALCADPQGWHDLALTRRKPVPRRFRDKLAPAYRFLSSRADTNWNESYALLRLRFDDRTTAGRHILFDHLLTDIHYVGEEHRSWWISRWGRFSVDERGVLRKVARPRRKPRLRTPSPCPAGMQASVYEAGCAWFDSKQGGRSVVFV